MMLPGALLLAVMASGQTEPSISARQAAEEVRVLREGDWNERVHATHELGDLGADGLPGLRVAAEDADWQVRMTAVHLMGRVGEAAVPDLARVLRSEPCREVRLTALHWLGAIGGEKASEALRGGLSDESGMVRLMGRYWLDKSAGRPEGAEPDAAAAEDEDLKFCEASPEPRRAPWASEKRTAPKATDDDSGSHVVTPDPPRPAVAPTALVPTEAAKKAAGNDASDRERLKELDALLSPDSGKDGDALSAAPARRSPRAELTERKERKPPESMPRGAPGLPPRPPTETAGAAIMPDAGTGRPQNDPFPALLKLLKDSDPAKRARAADDLGKRGALAASAEPALAAALRDGNARVRASAALALGNIGAPADPAVTALVRALKRGPEEVSWSAAVALGRIGTPRARRAFARYARQSAGDLVRGTKR